MTYNIEQTDRIERFPRPDIKKYQERRLHEALEYLQARSPYYQKLFKENNIEVQKIKALEDLSHIPLTGKSELQRYNSDFLCVPRSEIRDFMTTSGTLGDPVTIGLTSADLSRLAYNEVISFRCAGAKPGDVFQLMTTLDKRFMAGLAYYMGLKELGCGVVRVGNGIPELQWDTIRMMKPDAFMCVPSFIIKIIKYAEAHGIDYRNSSIKKAVCIGENLRNQDFSLNLLGKSIKDKWDIELYSTYASTEMGTTFCECPAGRGGHHHPELIICELIDHQGNVVKEGDEGELTITTLGVEGMPLLRLKTGDIARFHYEKCDCGRTTMRISPIIGRLNHMIKLKGTTLYPPIIFDILDNIPYIDNYVLVVSDNETGNDDLTIKLSTSRPQDEELIKELKDKFRAKIRVAPNIEVLPTEEIRRIAFPETSRKPIKFIDNRHEKLKI